MECVEICFSTFSIICVLKSMVILYRNNTILWRQLMNKINFLELTNTYSIVAFDPIKKQLGVGMQTHNFAACNRVIRAEPGIGVVATQSYTNQRYSFESIEMMRQGKSPDLVLKNLLGQDKHSQYRQVALIDAKGNIAAHTGSRCIAEAGHKIGKTYSCQANMMLKNTVWDAMGSAFERCDGELVDCILKSLEAAESEGGDIRGSQSAAITVVTSELSDEPWQDYIYDFKVYDHPKPLQELKRLVNLKKTSDYLEKSHAMLLGTELKDNEIFSSIKLFKRATNSIPNEDSKLQYQFYYAITLLNKGLQDESIALFKDIFSINPIWREVALRIAKAESHDILIQVINSI